MGDEWFYPERSVDDAIGACAVRKWRLLSLSQDSRKLWRAVLIDPWDRWEPGEHDRPQGAICVAMELMGELPPPPPLWTPAEAEQAQRGSTEQSAEELDL